MYQQGHNPFTTLEKKLSVADHVVGNLESFAKGDNGENDLKKPRLTTTVKTLNYLKSINLDIACLANNHVYDHLESGFTKTVAFLDQNEIKHLGAAISKKEASKPQILKKDSLKIGLLNYVTHDTNPNLPDDADITPNYFEFEKIISDIKNLKEKVDHVVLNLHWGGRVEGGSFPDFDQPQISKQLIDHGADLIVGHHSHTFQPYEIYKGKYIFYSLGNFCFSDFYFNGRYIPLPKKRRLTTILDVSFTKVNYSLNLCFYRNKINDFEKLKNYPVSFQNRVYKLILKRRLFWTLYFYYQIHLDPVIQFLSRDDLSIFKKINRLKNSFIKRVFA